MTISKKHIQEFQRKIFLWWEKNNRDLPWRHTHDPYKILVSEVMLQQTQVSRALPKYREFLLEFPTVYSLAKSPLSKVLLVWKGMGYNRRAQYLQKTAKAIVTEYGGEFPVREKDLLELPGIGLYTARAIAVFARKQDVAMVDTNIRQIIMHYFFHDIPQSEKKIQQAADLLVPEGKSWQWHQALMDYGAIAMPTIRKEFRQPKKIVKKAVPFKESPRFIRGRIIDMLRERPYLEQDLCKEIYSLYGKATDNIQHQITALIKEGMVERLHTGMIRLMEL